MKKIILTIVCLIGITTQSFCANYITRIFCDGGRFFFTTSEPQYATGSNRYVLGMDDKVRIAMVMAAYTNKNTVEITPGLFINDFDTEVKAIFVDQN